MTDGMSKNLPEFYVEPGMTSFRWLGVAGIELMHHSEILLIDPFLSRPKFWRLWFGRVKPNHALISKTIKDSEHILVTHAHFDHLMDVADVAKNTGAMVYGDANACALVQVCGLAETQVHQIQAGDRFKLGDFLIDVIPAKHAWLPGNFHGQVPSNLRFPLRLRDFRLGQYFCFLIQLPGLRLLDWCGIESNGAPPADVLFMMPTSRLDLIEQLLSAVNPRVVIPIHWDNMFRPITKQVRPYYEPPCLEIPPLKGIDLSQFKKAIQNISAGIEVIVPEIMHVYDLKRFTT